MSLVKLELIKFRVPANATLVALNHNLTILCYTYYSSTRHVHYVVIHSATPIRLCFRKKVTSLSWIYIDARDILIVSFESGYVGCFDVKGRLLFKQQIDSKPILSIYIDSSHRDIDRNATESTYASENGNIPNLFCLQSNGVIAITAHDLYSTLKYSNFDISLLDAKEKEEYFAQIEGDKRKQAKKIKQQKYAKYNNENSNPHKYSKRRKTTMAASHENHTKRKRHNNRINRSQSIHDDMLPITYRQYKQQQQHQQDAMHMDLAIAFTAYDDIKHNEIPITTILPLRPICNQVMCWKAKKISIANQQKLTCFAAYFCPKGRAQVKGTRHSMKHNQSTRSIPHLHNRHHRLSRSQSMFTLQHDPHRDRDPEAKHNSNINACDDDLSDLLDPQMAFNYNASDDNDEWMIVFCGSNPMLATAHLEIKRPIHIHNHHMNGSATRRGRRKKAYGAQMSDWFSAAKSLFISSKQKRRTQKQKHMDPSLLSKSPSKSQSQSHRNHEINNNEIKRKRKRNINSRSSYEKQKTFQHSIRDLKYSEYLSQFEYCNAYARDVSITDIVMSPHSEYGAFTDCFGRIWIWQCAQCQFVRVFKGYRRAQIAWCYVNRDIDELNINHKCAYIPRYIYRRSVLLLILYIESRGLLEFHHIACPKRLYAVNVFQNANMIYHLNYSISPPWSTVLFAAMDPGSNENKMYKLRINANIIKCKLRRVNEYWDRRYLPSNCNINAGTIRLLSDVEFIANVTTQQTLNVFGTQHISLAAAAHDCSDGIQWFVLIERCDGEICCGVQCINIYDVNDNDNENCFANNRNGWAYHCDGFLKHNASYTDYGWKYGKYDTIGILLNLSPIATLQFTLNGKLCYNQEKSETKDRESIASSIVTLPNTLNQLHYHRYIYRLAVSVALNSSAQIAIIAASK